MFLQNKMMLILRERDLMIKKEKGYIAPFEAVGVVAAQSIGEPGTQMSLSYDERVIVKDGEDIKIVEIGPFIDDMIRRFGAVSQEGHEICDLPVEMYALSLNGSEKMEWCRITALSRHRAPEKLIRITLASGRKITATPFHSFVIRKDNSIIPVSAASLKEGDRLPVMRRMPAAALCSSVNIKPVLEKSIAHMVSSNGMLYAYPRENSKPFPQSLELDEEFGWFTGIYIAEGSAARSYLSISNTNEAILEKVRSFASTRGFTVNEYYNARGFAPSMDVRINSTILAQFLKLSTGENSHEKKVPEFAYSASDEFVAALLRGYFDGDGNVNVERGAIRFSSASKELMDGIAILLARFGIFATKGRSKNSYTLSISYRYARTFLEKIGSDVEEKRSALEALAAHKNDVGYNSVDVVPGIGSLLLDAARKVGLPTRYVNNFTKRQRIGRSTLVKYLNILDTLAAAKKVDLTTLEPLRRAADGDVVWDEIVKIEYVSPASEFVYDFTVPGTETFTTFDGVVTHNTMRTFHYAGVAEHVPTGLPRLIEIVDAKKEPKKPIIDIYLKKSLASSRAEAEKLAKEISSVFISDVADVMEDLSKYQIKITYNEKDGKAWGISFANLRSIVEKYCEDIQVSDNVILIKPKKKKTQKKKKTKDVTAKSGESGAAISPEEKLGEEEVLNARYIRRMANRLKQTIVRGISGINKAVPVKSQDGNEYFVRASGYNIAGVLSHPSVDPTRIYTNNIKEIERLYGIEAARNAIIKEIKDVMDMQKLSVDIRHIILIADAMTYSGSIKPIGRHGLSGEKVGVLGRAAFEETVRHLVNAASRAMKDRLAGVTENIIVGQTVPVGTGKIKLLLKTK